MPLSDLAVSATIILIHTVHIPVMGYTDDDPDVQYGDICWFFFLIMACQITQTERCPLYYPTLSIVS